MYIQYTSCIWGVRARLDNNIVERDLDLRKFLFKNKERKEETKQIPFVFQASPKELVWVIRFGIFVVAAIATIMGLTIDTIYGLWYLCSDLVFVMLFPHLLGAVHFPFVNIYGAVIAYPLGLILRLGGGEPLISLKPFIKYPYYNDVDGQLFPFRLLSMLVTLATLLIISYIVRHLFESGILPKKYDILDGMRENLIPSDRYPVTHENFIYETEKSVELKKIQLN